LQSRAREARQEAAHAQQTARELEIRAGQDQSESLRVNIKASPAIETAQSGLNTTYSKLPAQITSAHANTYGATAAVNTSSSSVGTVVNTTA